MAIQSSLANRGLLDRHKALASSNTSHLQQIPIQIRVATMVVLSLMLIIFSVLTVARTGTISKILGPPRPYLPGNSLPRLPKDSECNPVGDDKISCIVHELGQDVYLIYGKRSRMIVRAAIRGGEHKIGDLITAWGFPTGILKMGTFINVTWGTRSAVLYTDSFRPESPVKFIQYDLQEQPSSVWRGFSPFEKLD